MTRLNLVLLMSVLFSALYLVGVQYDSRRLFFELDKARAQAHRLTAENERLQVEKRAQATPLRVEKMAKLQLQMRTATPAITHYATYADAANVQRQAALASAQTAQASQGRAP